MPQSGLRCVGITTCQKLVNDLFTLNAPSSGRPIPTLRRRAAVANRSAARTCAIAQILPISAAL